MSRKFVTPLALPADPTQPLEAATKQYVDSKAGGAPVWADGYPTYDARYVNAVGDIMTGPLEATRFIGTDAAPTSGNHMTRKDYVDAQVATRLTQAAADTRYVDVAGDAMSGALTMQNVDVVFRGDLNGFQFFDNTGTTLRARINTMADRVVWNSQQPLLFEIGAAERMRITTDGKVVIPAATVLQSGVPGDFWTQGSDALFVDTIGYLGSNGSNRVGMYSNTYRNAGGTSTNGGGFAGSAAVEVDPTGVVYFRAEAGVPAGNGPANVARMTPNAMEVYTPLYVDGQFRAFQAGLTAVIAGSGGTSYIAFYTNATNYSTLGTRSGYVGYSSANNLLLNNEIAGGNIYIDAGSGAGNIIYRFGGGEQFRMIPQAMLVSKTAYNTYSTAAGVEMWTADGQVMITQSTNTFNAVAHIGAADAAAVSFWRFFRGGTLIGQIRQVATTGVEYLTTSDKREKAFLRNVDDDDALTWLRAMAPVHFEWRDARALGEQIGFFAQDLYEVAPEAVGVGEGEPGDEDYVPWGTDIGKLMPRVVAAVQAMDRRLTRLEN